MKMVLSVNRSWLFFLFALMLTLTPTGKAGAEIFGTQETPSTDFRPFPKWTEVLDRVLQEKGRGSGNCAAKEFNACHLERWQRFIDKTKTLNKDKQITEINNFFNGSRYIVDSINWGVSDYWSTPGQFFDKNGDCEDYAIAKYLAFRALDWPVDALRIVIVQDLNLKVSHAILTVAHGGRNLVLDNQLSMVAEDRRISHYRPIYSLNENGWFRHRAP